MRIGVLAIQGDVREHRRHLERLGVAAPEIRTPRDLSGTDGIIMPGGESTAIGLLMEENGLLSQLRDQICAGYPVYGTCAGLILLAKDVEGPPPPRLQVLDITASRNAYGRQRASFEMALDIPALGLERFPAVFIRAPRITRMGQEVTTLAEVDGEPVMAQWRNILCSTFHPELTDDGRIHEYFVSTVAGRVIR